MVDSDALDDVYPLPDEQWRLTERNLACVWAGFHAHGLRRLILTGVYLHREHELAWIGRATRAERFITVALTASAPTLAERVRRREIGSAAEAQLERTLRQVDELAEELARAIHVVSTDGASVHDTAARIIAIAGWR